VNVLELIVGVIFVLLVAWVVTGVAAGWPRVPPAGGLVVLLLLALALPAAAQTPGFATPTPALSGGLSLWTATETSRGGSQALVIASRAEGIWRTGPFDAWGRCDADSAKDTSVNLADPSTYRNVMYVECWLGASRKVAGPLAVALFGGGQKSIQGGELGHGAATNSLCAGARYDTEQFYAVAGICNRYAPLDMTAGEQGPAVVTTMSIKVKDHVRLATNAGLRLKQVQTGPHDSGITPKGWDWKVTIGPAVGLGK
jgi:hypothetical protein